MPRRKARTRGIACPACHGFRLCVVRVTHACRGLVRRRWECTACGTRFNTEERVAKEPNVVPRPAADATTVAR
jgi:transcriptional regulator NrdR family protein